MRPWLVACTAAIALSCTDPERERIRATSQGKYDPDTGRLTELTYDRNENGRVDTWVAMDGARPLSARIDADEDGVADRWEEYDDQGRLARAGESRAGSGEPDLWAYIGADGQPERIEYIEVSDVTGREGVVRREFYEAGAKVRAEEDTDGDGLMDRWEQFTDGRLAAVEFDDDQKRDGVPAQRFIYDEAGALVAIETEPDGRGGYRQKRIID